MEFDYNTQRNTLILPEYGRHIQKMVQYIKSIDDRDKRNEQARALVDVMEHLHPHLREVHDFRHRLWDYVYVMADFDIDIDSPYPVPTPVTFYEKPQPLSYQQKPIRALHYGRNIENMVNTIADRPDSAQKDAMIAAMAHYMKKQYLIWNKDSVSDEIIFKDMIALSKGRIKIDPSLKLQDMQTENLRQPLLMIQTPLASTGKKNWKNFKKKKNSESR